MTLDGDLFLDDAGFAVVGFEGVVARREAGDDEVAVGVGDGEERMVHDVDVCEFPRMDIALEAEETFGLGEVEFQGARVREHGNVGFGIAFDRGDWMHVVHAIIQVGDKKLLTGLEADDVIFVDAVAEAQGDGLLRDGPCLFLKTRADDDEDIGEAIIFAGDEESCGDGTGMFGGAPGVHGNDSLLGARSEKCGATGNAGVFRIGLLHELTIGDRDG